eukprot:4641237-Prymnesium_polylepis.1
MAARFYHPTSPPHAPVVLSGPALLDYVPSTGLYRIYDAAPDLSFPCACAASGPLDVVEGGASGHQIVAMGVLTLDYATASGRFRVMHCPPLELRQGFPNPSCRKVGFGKLASDREVVYLGRGRVLLWERATLRYELWGFERRLPLLNASSRPSADGSGFFESYAAGVLAG